jgi:gluconate 2-dehydrogenase subunit 3-like protein
VSASPGPHGRYVRRQAGVAGRFPGFDVLGQAGHWDRVTRDLVAGRMDSPASGAFFSDGETACARALLNLLTGQQDDPRIPVLEMVDARLAAGETDGWRYADMPEDGQAWRDTLAYLDADAAQRCGTTFAAAAEKDQLALIQAVQDLTSGDWHGLNAAHVWSLWTRYACTALYAHPVAWNEIGFPGPAYPRGYMNAGVGKREPFEVRDARPSGDPVREGA